jgi:hypothetical protein
MKYFFTFHTFTAVVAFFVANVEHDASCEIILQVADPAK